MKPKDDRKVEAIFEAAITLTGSMGIAGLKMSDIAKTANIASGTLYTYFQSKEELLNTLFKHTKRQGVLHLTNELSGLPVKVQLLELWRNVLYYRVNNHNRTIFVEQFVISPYISSENKQLSQKFNEFIVSLLEEGKRQQIVKELDNTLLMSVLAGYARDLSFHVSVSNGELNEEMIRDSFRICWDAIKA